MYGEYEGCDHRTNHPAEAKIPTVSFVQFTDFLTDWSIRESIQVD